MAYNDELDRAVAQSNETLRAHQAANPVIANQARGPDIVTDPMQQLGYGGDTQGLIDLNARGAPSPGLGQRIDDRTRALVDARNAAPAPVIAPDMATPRSAGGKPGAISVAAQSPTMSVPVPQATQDLVASAARVANAPLSVVPGNPDYKAEYAMMRAREGQDARELGVARAAADRAIQANSNDYYAKIAAENATRGVYKPSVFDQMVTNASTVATPGGRGGPAPVIAAPVNMGQRALDINRDEAQRRNLVDEAIATQNAASARATSATSQEADKLKLEQQKRLNDLGSKLAASKDPKERDQISSTLLALLGKDKPEEYQVIHAPGAESVGPDGMTKLKGPDSIVIMNKRTGAREVMQMGAGPGGAPAADKYEAGRVYVDAKGNKAKYAGNGKWDPA